MIEVAQYVEVWIVISFQYNALPSLSSAAERNEYLAVVIRAVAMVAHEYRATFDQVVLLIK